MANSKGIITTGRFRFNNKDKEVNKTYKGNVASRSLYMGPDHIWPSYEILCIDKTTSFAGSKDSNYKDQETGLSTYNFSNYSYSSIAKDIDPAGGTVSTSIINRESSYWHCLSLEISAYTLCNKQGTGVVFDENAITYDTNIKVSDGSNYITKVERTESKTDVTIVDDDTNRWNVSRWLVTFNQKDDLPLDFATKGALLGITIPPNNYPFTSTGLLRITKFVNEFGELKDIPTEVHEGILTWTQNPNTIYKVQMCWVQGDGIATPLSKDEIQSMVYTTSTKSYWLCIELGVSKSGGTADSDFVWNQDLEPEISIPNDLASMVTVTISGTDANRFTVTVPKTVRTENKNYVEVVVTPTSNNDYSHNINRTPVYKSKVLTNNSWELASDDEEYDNSHQSSGITWQLERYTTTQPWDATISIKFTGTDSLSNFTEEM